MRGNDGPHGGVRSAHGRSGIMPRLAFSPRTANLTLYFSEGWERHRSRLEALGKHRTSVSCLYVTRLSDIDVGALERMLRDSHQHTLEEQPPQP